MSGSPWLGDNLARGASQNLQALGMVAKTIVIGLAILMT
jgi:hypothetical protein